MKKKTIDDINIDTIDLSKHLVTVHCGTKLYRIVHKGTDPLIPTGRESRFASQPPQYSPEVYKKALGMGTAISVGTGTSCFCESLATAKLEVGGHLQDKQAYEIILKSDITIVDMDSICRAEGINKPYITEERTEICHKFYGKKVKGLRYESSKNTKEYNIVIFPDWFPEFKSIVEVKKINE